MLNNYLSKINLSSIIEGFKILLLSLTGMLIALSLLNITRIPAGPFELLFSLSPLQEGSTVINLAPVGEIRAYTHWFFFQINITLLNIDPELLSASVHNAPDMEAWLNELLQEAKRGVLFLGIQCLLAAFTAGALLNYFLAPIRHPRRFLIGGSLSVFLLVLLIVITVIIPFNLEAFENPQYEGVISAAPWVMNFFDDGLEAVQDLSKQFANITSNVIDLFEHMEKFNPVDPASSLKVLHVSDIHNNPLAFEFIEKVVNVFQIDLIIDTGDITDYGSPLEAELASRVADFPVPYVFVPGNHDSPEVSSFLADNGVYVICNETVTIEGLKIVGISDPAYFDAEKVTSAEDELKKYAESKQYIFDEIEQKPHILAVHDPLIGNIWGEETELVLTGHTHTPKIEEDGDNIYINAGTTGASGIRGLKEPENVHYSMAIIYYNENMDNDEESEKKGTEGEIIEEINGEVEKPKVKDPSAKANDLSLYAADLISAPQITGGFKLERFMFD